MGFLSNVASGAIGYGLHALKTKSENKQEEERINAIKAMSLREYIDEYREIHGISLNKYSIESFVIELNEIARDYSLGI